MSTNDGAHLPDWKKLYQLAIAERNPSQLPQRIMDARHAILDRIEESLTKRGNYQERQELTDALNNLRVLREEYESRVRQYGDPRLKTG
jgi:hypothetical protein